MPTHRGAQCTASMHRAQHALRCACTVRCAPCGALCRCTVQCTVLQVPLFANPASFARPVGQKIWLDEALMTASDSSDALMTVSRRARRNVHAVRAPLDCTTPCTNMRARYCAPTPVRYLARRGSWQRCRGCSGPRTTRASVATRRSTPRPTTSPTCARRLHIGLQPLANRAAASGE